MKRAITISLVVLLTIVLASCLKLKGEVQEVEGAVLMLHSKGIDVQARETLSGFEITLNQSISSEAVKVSSDFLKIVKESGGMTTIAVVKPSGDIRKGERILTISGDFKTLKGIVADTSKEYMPRIHRAPEPLPDGISIRDAEIAINSNGVFYIHASNINGVGGSELNISFDPAYLEIDTTKGNNGVEALNTYSSGIMIVHVDNVQGELMISTAFSSPEGVSITSEDIYAVHVKAKTNKGITELAMTGEVKDPATIPLNVAITGGQIEIGAPKLLGDFDNDDQVGLDDFIRFAQHYGTTDGDGVYEVIYDIAPAEDYYGGVWNGIYDKCSPDRVVNLSDFIIFAKNYYEKRPVGPLTDPTLTDLTVGEPETLDPHICYETAGGGVILNLYDNLIKYKGDSVTEFEPMISTEVPTVENGLIQDGGTKYVFPIREGVKFHSGNVLTPYDVEYSFERGILFDPSGGPMWMIIEALSGGEYHSLEDWFQAYSGMAYSDAVDGNRNPTSEDARTKLIAFYNEVIDPLIEVDGQNVVFTLQRPFGPFMWIIAHYANWSAILDAEWAKANGAWDGNADGWWQWHNLQPEETPLHSVDAGSGPFKVAEWDRAQAKVVLERFDDYWAGPAKLKTVIIWGIDEYSTRKAMLEAGYADIIYVPIQYKNEVVGMPGVRIIDGYPTSAITSFHFNWSIDPASPYIGSGQLDGNGIPPDFFSDPHVRKAFYYCYDGATFIEQVLNGYGKLVPTDLPEGYLGYDPTLPLPEFNLDKAAAEFQQAFNGELWNTGFRLTLLYNIGNEARQRAAEMFKSHIESLNSKFHIDVQGVDWTTYLNAQRAGYMPAFIIGWLADYPDPHNFFVSFYSSYGVYAYRQGAAFLEFARTNIDPLITAAIMETDPAMREELYIQIQNIAIENTLSVPLYMPLGFHVERDWVKGWYPHPIRSRTNYYEIDKEQTAEPEPGTVSVTFKVTLPSNTPEGPVYIAGNFNEWNPGDPRYEMTRSGNMAEITLYLPTDSTIEYKYTRGDWGKVEKGEAGEEISNRKIVIYPAPFVVEDIVASWADIPPEN